MQQKSEHPSFAIPEAVRLRFEHREKMLRMIQEQEERRRLKPDEPPPPMPAPEIVHLPHGAFVGNLIATIAGDGAGPSVMYAAKALEGSLV